MGSGCIESMVAGWLKDARRQKRYIVWILCVDAEMGLEDEHNQLLNIHRSEVQRRRGRKRGGGKEERKEEGRRKEERRVAGRVVDGTHGRLGVVESAERKEGKKQATGTKEE